MVDHGTALKNRSYLFMHLAVILFGFTAILGDLISLPTPVLVCWRVVLTSASLILIFKFTDLLIMYRSGYFWKIAGIGIIVSLHWLCFYGSIKTSNASLALVCMSSTSVFTAFIEPLVHRTPIRKKDVLLGLLMIPCFILITRNIPEDYDVGLLLGIGAAILAAIFSVLNKKFIGGQNVFVFTFVELTSASVFLVTCLGVMFYFNPENVTPLIPAGMVQWIYLLLLAWLCTTLAYVLSLKALSHISAFSANMIINLEPVYGIILAMLLLGEKEHMHFTFYIGAGLITIVVLMYPFLLKQNR